MDYVEVTCTVNDNKYLEIIVAKLGAVGYEMFEETGSQVKAYIPAHLFNADYKNEFAGLMSNGVHILFEEKRIPHQNWNEVWESNFEPVVVADKVYIRAAFHSDKAYPYSILINPKMAFGTGHHATTCLMMEFMLSEDFRGKRVMDMGCGTGILSILAQLLGAAAVTAVDNDSTAAENARENCLLNNAGSVEVFTGDARFITPDTYDVLLANINRNIILNDIGNYADGLRSGGTAFFSGFYREDAEAVTAAAVAHNLKFVNKMEKDNWACIKFSK